jgi:VWFA-related protein
MSKKPILLAASIAMILTIGAHSQQQRHDVSVINIEVPVRVFRGDAFIDSLTLDDFEVYEDGKLQKVEAAYLVKKMDIQKGEGKKFVPQVSRTFVLLFQMTDYLPEVEDALDYFFNEVIIPQDNLIVVTSMRTYNLRDSTWEFKTPQEVSKQLKGIVRRDAEIGGSQYRNLIGELEDNMLGDLELDQKLFLYSQTLKSLENLRYVDEKKLLEFADFLKAREGQKYVFLFYQKELLPQIDTSTLNQLMSLSQDRQDTLQQLSDLFSLYSRDIPFKVDMVKKVYADSSISIHFLFLTKTQTTLSVTSRGRSFMQMRERSEDIYSAFKEMARATGGLADSSADAASSFQKVVDAAENYYLLYYTPDNDTKDGKFREIKVRVKNKDYRVLHRAGYFAD